MPNFSIFPNQLCYLVSDILSGSIFHQLVHIFITVGAVCVYLSVTYRPHISAMLE